MYRFSSRTNCPSGRFGEMDDIAHPSLKSVLWRLTLYARIARAGLNPVTDRLLMTMLIHNG
jgi:hypothetical protein